MAEAVVPVMFGGFTICDCWEQGRNLLVCSTSGIDLKFYHAHRILSVVSSDIIMEHTLLT